MTPRRRTFRSPGSQTAGLVALALAAAAWAACTDEAAPADPADAGVDSSVGAGPDAAPSGCEADVDADGVWRHLECTGLYASLADKTVAADVRPYKPALEFWSDGAEKQRWVHLPAGSKIDIGSFDEWKLPVGTKLWKEFKIGGKRIETRLYAKTADGTWVHAAYRWNADETEAVNRGGEVVPGIGPDGGPYEIPTSGQCDQCHRGKDDQALGFDAVSLGLPGATGETLAKLSADGLLSATPPKTSLTLPGSDEAAAAVGWIHANCGSCHTSNPSGSATHRSHLRVRATDLAPTDGGTPTALESLDVWTEGYCKDSFRTDPDGAVPFKWIRGGNPDKSLLYILASHRVGFGDLPSAAVQMPPIVSRAVDQDGVALLRAWIEALPACPP